MLNRERGAGPDRVRAARPIGNQVVPRRRRRHGRSPDLGGLLDHPRFEVLPVPGIEAEVIRQLPADATVTVTASPRRGMAATLEVAIRLSSYGVRVVPHLSARMITDEAELKQMITDLSAARVGEVFVISGDPDTPAGAFGSSLELLQAMRHIGHEFTVGVAGYPETHPKISDDLTVQAMWDKRRYASYIVSQMCFDSRVLLAWIRRVRRRGVQLPIHVGVAGPASTAQLLRISSRIGVGGSARMLSQNTGLLRLAKPGTWRPDALIDGLAPAIDDQEYGLAGLHIYTFNAVATAERWRQQTIQRSDGEVRR